MNTVHLFFKIRYALPSFRYSTEIPQPTIIHSRVALPPSRPALSPRVPPLQAGQHPSFHLQGKPEVAYRGLTPASRQSSRLAASMHSAAARPAEIPAGVLFGRLEELGLASDAAILSMRRHMRSGRFSTEYYEQLWADRIAVAAAAQQERQHRLEAEAEAAAHAAAEARAHSELTHTAVLIERASAGWKTVARTSRGVGAFAMSARGAATVAAKKDPTDSDDASDASDSTESTDCDLSGRGENLFDRLLQLGLGAPRGVMPRVSLRQGYHCRDVTAGGGGGGGGSLRRDGSLRARVTAPPRVATLRVPLRRVVPAALTLTAVTNLLQLPRTRLARCAATPPAAVSPCSITPRSGHRKPLNAQHRQSAEHPLPCVVLDPLPSK